jgi:pimeloyl-ACP methyl ester carboxylesterase
MPQDKLAAAVSPRRSSRFGSALKTLLHTLVLVLIGFFAVLYSLQDRVIFPGAATQGTPQAALRPRPGEELITLTTKRGEKVVAFFGPALLPDGKPHPAPMSRPAFLYFYGNAMCLAYAEPEFDRFRRLGLNVMIPDYLGYGLSSGKPSESGCRETAEACLENLQTRGFKTSRIIVGGWSLGGAVAIDLAHRQPVGGLIAFSSFTSAQDMARNLIPIPLPRLLFHHRFENLNKIPSITCPILLGHGRLDTLVPFAMFGRLAAAAKAPLTKLVIDHAEHNDYYDVGGKEIDQAIMTFVDQLPQ